MHGYQLGVAHFARIGGISDGPYLNLSSDDCGTSGHETKTFACDVNTGQPFALFGSITPPNDVHAFVGMMATMTVHSSSASLPDWWKFGSAAFCRGTSAMTSSFDFTAGPAGCADAYFSLAQGGYAYDVGFGAADRGRLRVQCAVPAADSVDLSAGVEYGLFRVNLLRSKTTGSGSCAGCSQPMTISLDEVELFKYGGTLGTVHGVRDRAFVRWQNAVASIPPTVDARLRLLAARWESGGRAGHIAFTLPHAGSATLELFDVTGRRRAREALEGLGDGVHEAVLRPATPLAAGAYFLRLSQGQDAVTRPTSRTP